jgi:hypothetical protein
MQTLRPPLNNSRRVPCFFWSCWWGQTPGPPAECVQTQALAQEKAVVVAAAAGVAVALGNGDHYGQLGWLLYLLLLLE